MRINFKDKWGHDDFMDITDPTAVAGIHRKDAGKGEQYLIVYRASDKSKASTILGWFTDELHRNEEMSQIKKTIKGNQAEYTVNDNWPRQKDATITTPKV